MAKLVWDPIGEHLYKLGVDKVVLFPWDSTQKKWDKGVAWNGVTTITDSPSGADENKYYANNKQYLSIRGLEQFGFTIEAYQSPEEFDKCDGQAVLAPGFKITQQKREAFCLVYRKLIGNDTEGIKHDYEYHFLYNATCSPTEETAETVNESPEPGTMSWECSTTAVEVPGYEPTSRAIVIASGISSAALLKKLEDTIYGVDADPEHSIEASDPTLLYPAEIQALLLGTDDDDELHEEENLNPANPDNSQTPGQG